jgi:putative ABC transport system permease protein
MDQILQDIKYSLRMFGQQRAFTIAAVAALALGIGATTAVFSVVNASLLRPFPYPDADRIVIFMNTSPGGSGPAASPAKFAHWQHQTQVVQDVSAFRSGIVNFTGGDTPEQLKSGQVSEAYFRLLGAKTILGRTFTADEDRSNGPRVAVISYGWWKRRFGGDPAIVGKTISLSGEPYVVVGVLGQNFDPSELGDAADVWTPFQLDPNSNDQGHYFMAAGRLKPGVTLAQAKGRLAASADEYRRKFANALGPKQGFSVDRLQDVFVRGSKTLFEILFAAVAGVLLIACANVANLLLVRATVRKREMAIRAAIGAGRGRIVRQLMTESVLLAIMGGVLGLALGLFGIRWLLSINTAGLPRVGDGGSFVHLDWRVLVFTAVISIGTGLLFGVFPALHAVRDDLSGALRESSGSASGGRSTLRSGLVVLEIALALTLVVGSGLLIRTSMALRAVPPGFDPHNVLVMNMAFTGSRYATSSAVDQTIHEGVVRLNALPGVEVASAACCVPLQGGYGLPFNIVGKPSGKGPWMGGGDWVTVSPGYFAVFKIPVIRGRAFTEQDNAGGPPVVIINEAMAKLYWKKGDPLSDRLTIGRGVMKEFAAEPDRQIIGVVADSRDDGLNQDPQPKMFIPQGQVPDLANALNMRLSPTSWVIRTKVPPLTLSASVQAQLRQATGLPASNVQTMDEIVSKSTSREQFNTLLMTIFASSALLLAAIGIYGVMAYAVQQRTREIGVRLALGAEPGRVRSMVVFQGMRLAIIGVALGLGAAFALSRYMSSLLFGVQPRDPLVFVGVPVLLAVIALLAVWIPAGRASRIDPLGALRSA